jgi:hypothetical protein
MILFALLPSVNAQNIASYCRNTAFFAKYCFTDATLSSSCCTHIIGFKNNGCFCNKVAVALLSTTTSGAPTQAKIASSYAQCNSPAPPAPCQPGPKTYNGGTCPLSDLDLDFARFIGAKKFSDALLSFSKQNSCFDYPGFRNKVATFFTSNAVAYAGQGLGTYSGLDHIAEYFSLLSPKVNRDFLAITSSDEPSTGVSITPNGKNITIQFWVANRFAGGTYAKTIRDYLELIYTYNGCDTKASIAYVPGTSSIYAPTNTISHITGVAKLVDMLYKTVNLDLKNPNNPNLPLLGIVSICKQHTKYCLGANSQFASESACMKYFRALPRMSAKCGTAALASGNSVTCRAKHQFMAAISPEIHCQHLGRFF